MTPTPGDPTGLRVLRVYHCGRDPAHRRRERALLEAGVALTLVVPSSWPDPGSQGTLPAEPFRVVELAVRREGDVNRHTYQDDSALAGLIDELQPDVVDLHEEPFSLVARQWLRLAGDRPVVMYTAQNIDKRFPPPYAGYETRALRRVSGLYPCSRQAASVARGKGFRGVVDVLPLGIDPAVHHVGGQAHDDPEFALLLVGRMVAEKGVQDAVSVLAATNQRRPARLRLVGDGPELGPAIELAHQLGVGDRVEVIPWCTAARLGELYRQAHVTLIPSRRTFTWVEQFGRVILEAQASGAVVAGYASGSIPEVAGPGAVLVEEGDRTALATAVAELAQHEADFDRRRQAGVAAAGAATWANVARRQVGLYRAALARRGTRAVTPSEPRRAAESRASARAEFGPPAVTAAGERPFALPVLRSSALATHALGGTLDRVGEFLRR